MPKLEIKNFAQLANASVEFGDLTLLVGPQATGKSLILQLLKYAIDRPVIATHLRNYGVDWNRERRYGLMAAFLGEGYEKAFARDTSIDYDGKSLLEEKWRASARDPKVFFVPAQRVVTISNGWPRPFTSFEAGDPYVARQFSQDVLEQFGRGLGRGGAVIFPPKDRLKAPLRRSIEMSIFHGGQLLLKSEGGRKRLIIQYDGRSSDEHIDLPFFEWSAGQREFAPLLLGLYQLLPAGKITAHQSYKWAIIEEPEMGLHPQAINSVMLLVFELMARGYKVCMSTHSPYVLELMWAIGALRASRSPRRVRAVLEALNVSDRGKEMQSMARNLLTKDIRAYALTFDADRKHRCTDISDFDLDSHDPNVAGWGGITSLSAIVSRAVAKGL